jgi:hypothetical protein
MNRYIPLSVYNSTVGKYLEYVNCMSSRHEEYVFPRDIEVAFNHDYVHDSADAHLHESRVHEDKEL